ncbi:hypothetical protein [Methylobacterium sp. WL7]|uniref:hypothetical protein n=1 Tax=Methylobacterium sp. WL7 TaxID=2603900 RepID=UPI0011C85D8D|nr:hypothetical protein [Methylobacterium sp. WL7]TXN36346.1 hypothetical protein FV233_29545 [Methylobacterium sp. WL7]
MRILALLFCLLSAPVLAQSTQTIPFRRMSEPVMVQIGPTPQTTMIPAASLKDPMNGLPLSSFYVVNPNSVYVRVKGFSNAADCANIGVTETTGWLWPPGFVGVFSTQYPFCASAMAVSKPGFPITASTTYAPLEWSYGPGQ